MRRDVVLAFGMAAVMLACSQNAETRARNAAARARGSAVVRESETVQRVATPVAYGRVIYEAPVDLSESNLRRTNAPVFGLEPPAPAGASARR